MNGRARKSVAAGLDLEWKGRKVGKLAERRVEQGEKQAEKRAERQAKRGAEREGMDRQIGEGREGN